MKRRHDGDMQDTCGIHVSRAEGVGTPLGSGDRQRRSIVVAVAWQQQRDIVGVMNINLPPIQ